MLNQPMNKEIVSKQKGNFSFEISSIQNGLQFEKLQIENTFDVSLFVSTLPITPCQFLKQGVLGHDEHAGYLFTIILPEFEVIPFILNLYIYTPSVSAETLIFFLYVPDS
jgi:hypothetical protein